MGLGVLEGLQGWNGLAFCLVGAAAGEVFLLCARGMGKGGLVHRPKVMYFSSSMSQCLSLFVSCLNFDSHTRFFVRVVCL